jgi:hypothetical protein
MQTGIVVVSVLLVGWWFYAVLKRLGQPDDALATLPAESRRGPRRERSSSLAPHAGLAAIVFALMITPPAAFALAPTLGERDSSRVQGAVAQLSASSMPAPSATPSPSPSMGDVPAAPEPAVPSAAVVDPTPSPPQQPIAPWPAPWPQPTAPPPTPTPRPTPVDNPPTAILNATPVGGGSPLHVTANAALSWDKDATGIVSYQFNWGDGLSTVSQASPTATHIYNVRGSYTLTVIVVDRAGLWSTASTTIKVT